MLGDLIDIAGRLRAVLPGRWFQDSAPNLNAVLTCLATPWSWFYNLLVTARQQTRIATASGSWLDLIALDFFGAKLQRQAGELDSAYRGRIEWALIQSAATRPAIVSSLTNLTGSPPQIFEPANAGDTGAYGGGLAGSTQRGSCLAYGFQGGWGSLLLPYQFFATVQRPRLEGVSMIAGYSTTAAGYGVGPIAYIDLAMLAGNTSDEDIAAALSSILPINTTAWLRLT